MRPFGSVSALLLGLALLLFSASAAHAQIVIYDPAECGIDGSRCRSTGPSPEQARRDGEQQQRQREQAALRLQQERRRDAARAEGQAALQQMLRDQAAALRARREEERRYLRCVSEPGPGQCTIPQ